MEQLHFLGATIDEFHFEKNIRKDTGMRLEATVKFAVRYNKESDRFAGDAIVTVQDAGHEGLFRLKFHHVGVFACSGVDMEKDEDKRRLHMEAAAMLQPIWNQTVTLFSAMAGIPPIKLPPYRVPDGNIRTE